MTTSAYYTAGCTNKKNQMLFQWKINFDDANFRKSIRIFLVVKIDFYIFIKINQLNKESKELSLKLIEMRVPFPGVDSISHIPFNDFARILKE